jgi:hypothetical protein
MHSDRWSTESSLPVSRINMAIAISMQLNMAQPKKVSIRLNIVARISLEIEGRADFQ